MAATPCSTDDQHVGHPVLDPLELADRPAELLAGAGVLGGRVDAPPGTADGFGRQDDERQVPHGARGHVEDPLRPPPGPAERPRRHRSGRVEAVQLHHFGGVGPLEHHPAGGVAHGDRGEHVGHDGTVHQRTDRAGHHERAVRPGLARQSGRRPRGAVGRRRREGQRRGQTPVGQPGQECLGQLPATVGATTPATTAVVSHGPTAAARPSSSATTASSTIPAPWPPNSSATWMPSSPWAARSPSRAGRCRRRRRGPRGRRPPRHVPRPTPGRRRAAPRARPGSRWPPAQAPKRWSRWSIENTSQDSVNRATTAARIIIRFWPCSAQSLIISTK